MKNLKELLPEYAAIAAWNHTVPKLGLLSPVDVENFKLVFGIRLYDFYNKEIYYVGKDEETQQHYFTNKDGWYSYRQSIGK